MVPLVVGGVMGAELTVASLLGERVWCVEAEEVEGGVEWRV